jgi:hypothetical protein
MQSFNAVIKIGEDERFRKAVIDAMKAETKIQIEKNLLEMLPGIVREFISDARFMTLITNDIKTAVGVNIRELVRMSSQTIIDEQKGLARKMFDDYLSKEAIEDIVIVAARRYIQDRLKS